MNARKLHWTAVKTGHKERKDDADRVKCHSIMKDVHILNTKVTVLLSYCVLTIGRQHKFHNFSSDIHQQQTNVIQDPVTVTKTIRLPLFALLIHSLLFKNATLCTAMSNLLECLQRLLTRNSS